MSMDRDEIIETAARAMCEHSGKVTWGQLNDEGQRETLREAEAALLAVGAIQPAPPPSRPGDVRRGPSGEVAVRVPEGPHPWIMPERYTFRWVGDDHVDGWESVHLAALVDDLRDAHIELDRLKYQINAIANGRDRALERISELEGRRSSPTKPEGGTVSPDYIEEATRTSGLGADAGVLAVLLTEGKHAWIDWDDEEIHVGNLAEAIRENLPAATRDALPEGHVAIDLRWADKATLKRWAYQHPDWGDDSRLLRQAVEAEVERRANEGGGS